MVLFCLERVYLKNLVPISEMRSYFAQRGSISRIWSLFLKCKVPIAMTSDGWVWTLGRWTLNGHWAVCSMCMCKGAVLDISDSLPDIWLRLPDIGLGLPDIWTRFFDILPGFKDNFAISFCESLQAPASKALSFRLNTRGHVWAIRHYQTCTRHPKTPLDMHKTTLETTRHASETTKHASETTRHASYTTGHHQTSPDMHQTPPDMH